MCAALDFIGSTEIRSMDTFFGFALATGTEGAWFAALDLVVNALSGSDRTQLGAPDQSGPELISSGLYL